MLANTLQPSPAEQADNIVLFLGNVSEPGVTIKLDVRMHRSIAGSASDAGFVFVSQHLIGEGLVEGYASTGGPVRLTFRGWRRFEELKHGEAELGMRGFMAMEYSKPPLDDLFKNHFKAAARRAGFDLFRLDEQPKAGSIDDRMRLEIRRSRFVVADLTHGNQGAYWEAGFAEGLGRPVIYTCEQKVFDEKKTHFDTNHLYTLGWQEGHYQDAAEALTLLIRTSVPGALLEDPVDPS